MKRWLPGFALLAFLYYFGLIGCGGSDFTSELCGGYYVYETSTHQVHVSSSSWNSDTPRIPEKVVDLGHDDRFIIAKQNHLKRRNLRPSDTYMEPDPGVYSYWILDTSIPKVYGPLTEEEFKKTRRDLGVPVELEMKDVHSFRE